MGPFQGLLAGQDTKGTEDTQDLKETKVPIIIDIAILDKNQTGNQLPD